MRMEGLGFGTVTDGGVGQSALAIGRRLYIDLPFGYKVAV